MNIPDKIKIGGFNIKVQKKDRLGIDHNKFGDYNGNLLLIRLCSDNCKEQDNETLIHEIFEAVNGKYELELPHQTITILGAVFHQIIVDNPEMFKEEKTKTKEEANV